MNKSLVRGIGNITKLPWEPIEYPTLKFNGGDAGQVSLDAHFFYNRNGYWPNKGTGFTLGIILANSGAPDNATIYSQSGITAANTAGVSDIFQLPTFTKLSSPFGTDTNNLLPNTSNGVDVSSNGIYVAFAHSGTPYITVYKRSGNVFTKLSALTALASTGNAVKFSPDGTYLAAAHNITPFVTIYKRSGDTFTKLTDPATLPTSTANSLDWDATGTYLAVAHGVTPFVTIYKRSGDTFTKLSNPTGGLPAGTGNGVSFSPNTNYLAVCHATSPYFTVYSRSGDSFAKVTNATSLPPAATVSASWDPSGTILALAHATTPFITLYDFTNGTYTKLSNPANLPSGTGYSVEFTKAEISNGSSYLLVGHTGTPFFTIYRLDRSFAQDAAHTLTKVSDPANLPPSLSYWATWLYVN